jgi:hypothetical protein
LEPPSPSSVQFSQPQSFSQSFAEPTSAFGFVPTSVPATPTGVDINGDSEFGIFRIRQIIPTPPATPPRAAEAPNDMEKRQFDITIQVGDAVDSEAGVKKRQVIPTPPATPPRAIQKRANAVAERQIIPTPPSTPFIPDEEGPDSEAGVGKR